MKRKDLTLGHHVAIIKSNFNVEYPTEAYVMDTAPWEAKKASGRFRYVTGYRPSSGGNGVAVAIRSGGWRKGEAPGWTADVVQLAHLKDWDEAKVMKEARRDNRSAQAQREAAAAEAAKANALKLKALVEDLDLEMYISEYTRDLTVAQVLSIVDALQAKANA